MHLEHTNEAFLDINKHTTRICMGSQVGSDRSCKIVHHSGTFCPLQTELDRRKFNDLKLDGEYSLGAN